MARLAARSPPPNERGREGVGGTNEHATETDGRRDRRVCIWIREIRAKASETSESLPSRYLSGKKSLAKTRTCAATASASTQVERLRLFPCCRFHLQHGFLPNFWGSYSRGEDAINLVRERGGEILEYGDSSEEEGERGSSVCHYDCRRRIPQRHFRSNHFGFRFNRSLLRGKKADRV